MKPNRPFKRAPFLSITVLFALIATQFVYQIHVCAADTQITAEQYVLEQVQAGKPALLGLRFADEKDRVLTFEFLRKLLTNTATLPVHPHGIMIDGAIINDEFDLINEEIPYDTSLTNCKFLGELNLTQSRFAKSLNLAGSSFAAESDFESATITFDLNAEGSKFLADSFFKSLRVGGDFRINKAGFTRAANFSDAQISGNLIADGTEFHGTADFENLNVKGDASFRDERFFGYVNFNEARLINFFLTDSNFAPDNQTDLSRLKLESGFLENVNFNHNHLKIDGISFQYLSPASWDQLQNVASNSQYNAEFYSGLEALFQRHGYMDEANQVYVAQQRRERRELLHGLPWLWNLLKDVLVGYGRHLDRLLIWSAVLVVVGYFVFRNESGMETIKPDDKAKYANRYHPFWYSLDLFLPILTLGDKSIWTPRSDRKFALMYRRFHIILGYLFVPIGVAAWSGIIR